MERIFWYKGYRIEPIDYNYVGFKWQASSEIDCDEPMITSKTFDEMLDIIDELN